MIHNVKKKILLLFFEFFGGFSFEDLQKNTSKMWDNSVIFESRLFCVSCLAQKSVLPGGRNSGQKGQKWADNKSVLEEFKAEFYQK